MNLPVITLWQPWASWIAFGWKTIETRTHDRFYSLQGETIGIHAGLQYDKKALELARDYMTKRMSDTIKSWPMDYPKGKLLCLADVMLVRELNYNDSEQALIECHTKRWGLFLRNIQILTPPIEMKGKQGIWYVEYKSI